LKTLSTINIFIICLTLSACASKSDIATPASNTGKQSFEMRDKSGLFRLVREFGPVANSKKVLAVKQVVQDSSGVIFERSIVMGRIGSLKGKVNVLRPEKSEYTVWFDGKEYTNRIEINTKLKAMVVNLKSPEPEWNGEKTFTFPPGTGAYCYFSQILECAQVMNFMPKAIAAGGGAMNLHVVWEGYPYFQQQYVGIPDELFTQATFSYDGENHKGLRRFSLSISNSNQIIFYHVHKDNSLAAIFWPAQGLSIGSTGSDE
tara:strand:- start:13153 stop:13932 length:780 start_codon:yes stop_codon:yes gene_type:complete